MHNCKSTALKNLKDGARFRFSNRKGSVVYKLQSKKKGVATYTSMMSERTFTRSVKEFVYVKGSGKPGYGWPE